jgi:hypothetical protein
LEVDGDSFATLIRNKDDKEQPFRIVATIYSADVSNIAFDIVPVSTAVPGSTTTTSTKASSTASSSTGAASPSSSSTTSTRAATAHSETKKLPKRSVGDEPNKHAIFRREVSPRNEDDNQLLIEKNVSLEDDFADTKAGKLIGSVHKSKKLTAK